ncbi:hypothetical protein FN846DRAFT_943203 [Sphaerosporella brunnea]|uniref:DUF676 domain-containing protein n=1 Tax=Sphaerosporella brunnea TaxID=1250544 RepID=A0A5J5F0D6_9PEZI|nr:hypothetical protein FN846DRAFT_943203 [Sphaerosporella brunnea]
MRTHNSNFQGAGLCPTGEVYNEGLAAQQLPQFSIPHDSCSALSSIACVFQHFFIFFPPSIFQTLVLNMASASQLIEVYAPANEPVADIVFVHGLNPLGQNDYIRRAWTHPDGTLWPKHLLPKDTPNSRIMLFGYNANNASNFSAATTRAHANALLERVDLSRSSPQAKRRRLVFVGHSLGGLIIKQALVDAQGRYTSIKQATHGVVFFGTPHQGGSKETLCRITANIIAASGGSVSNDLMLSLERDSQNARNANEVFRQTARDIEIVNFFECRNANLKKPVGMHTAAIVVDAKSATLGMLKEHQINMDCNHTAMCRFSGRDHMYEPVGGQFRRLAEGRWQ